MTEVCSAHGKNAVVVCLYPKCANKKLCHLCIRSHATSHDSHIRDIRSLAEDSSWLDNLESLKDKLTQETELLICQKQEKASEDEKRVKLKMFIAEVFQKLREELTQKENEILKDFDDREEREYQNTILKLKERLKSIQEQNFRNSDYFKRVFNGLNFEDSEKQNTEILLAEVRKALEPDFPDEKKFCLFQRELSEIIKRINFTDFLLSKPEKSWVCNHEPPKPQPLPPQNIKLDFDLVKKILRNPDHQSCGVQLTLGKSEIYYCKGSNCGYSGGIWGSHPYTSDSNKCAALRHNGLSLSGAGCFVIEYIEGKSAYQGTQSNGVITSSYGSYGGSIVLSKLNC